MSYRGWLECQSLVPAPEVRVNHRRLLAHDPVGAVRPSDMNVLRQNYADALRRRRRRKLSRKGTP